MERINLLRASIDVDQLLLETKDVDLEDLIRRSTMDESELEAMVETMTFEPHSLIPRFADKIARKTLDVDVKTRKSLGKRVSMSQRAWSIAQQVASERSLTQREEAASAAIEFSRASQALGAVEDVVSTQLFSLYRMKSAGIDVSLPEVTKFASVARASIAGRKSRAVPGSKVPESVKSCAPIRPLQVLREDAVESTDVYAPKETRPWRDSVKAIAGSGISKGLAKRFESAPQADSLPPKPVTKPLVGKKDGEPFKTSSSLPSSQKIPASGGLAKSLIQKWSAPVSQEVPKSLEESEESPGRLSMTRAEMVQEALSKKKETITPKEGRIVETVPSKDSSLRKEFKGFSSKLEQAKQTKSYTGSIEPVSSGDLVVSPVEENHHDGELVFKTLKRPAGPKKKSLKSSESVNVSPESITHDSTKTKSSHSLDDPIEFSATVSESSPSGLDKFSAAKLLLTETLEKQKQAEKAVPDIEVILDTILADSEDLTELSMVNHPFFKKYPAGHHEKRILEIQFAEALSMNTSITSLNLACCGLDDHFLIALSEFMLKGRLLQLQALNLETNFITGKSIEYLAKVLEMGFCDPELAEEARLFDPEIQSQLIEIKLVNQKELISTAAEQAIEAAMKKNTRVLKLSVNLRNLGSLKKVEHYIIRNVDLIRLDRQKDFPDGELENPIFDLFRRIAENDAEVTQVLLVDDWDFMRLDSEKRSLLTDSLKKNSRVKILRLQGIGLNNDFAFALSESLLINKGIQEVVLNHNHIMCAGIEAICEVLKTNLTLQKLSIKHQSQENPLSSAAEQKIVDIMKDNLRVTELKLDFRNLVLESKLNDYTQRNKAMKRV